jgi:hypothetical protein
LRGGPARTIFLLERQGDVDRRELARLAEELVDDGQDVLAEVLRRAKLKVGERVALCVIVAAGDGLSGKVRAVEQKQADAQRVVDDGHV